MREETGGAAPARPSPGPGRSRSEGPCQPPVAPSLRLHDPDFFFNLNTTAGPPQLPGSSILARSRGPP